MNCNASSVMLESLLRSFKTPMLSRLQRTPGLEAMSLPVIPDSNGLGSDTELRMSILAGNPLNSNQIAGK